MMQRIFRMTVALPLMTGAFVLAQEPNRTPTDAEHTGPQTVPGATATDKTTFRDRNDMSQTGRMDRNDMSRTDSSMKHGDHGTIGTRNRLSKWMGMDIYDNNGKKLGDIKDIVLDGNDNRVSYAVLSYGGVLGMGETLFAVPWGALQQKGDDQLTLGTTADQLKNAPGFDKAHWPNMADPMFRKNVDTFYKYDRQGKGKDGGSAAALDMGDATDLNRSKTGDMSDNKNDMNKGTMGNDKNDMNKGTMGNDRMNKDSMNRDSMNKDSANKDSMNRDSMNKDQMSKGLMWTRRASEVIGADVTNANKENLGDIKDLVVDTSGKVRYAVLSFGGILGMGEKLFAVPMNNLQSKADEKKFVLNIDKNKLKDAPGFEDKNWPNFADKTFQTSVSNYYHDSNSNSGSDTMTKPMD